MKKITLSNSEPVTLIFKNDDPHSYIIEAYNQNDIRVGYCYFNIIKTFERDLTEDELAMLRRVCSNPHKTSTLIIDKSDKDDFQIANDILYYVNKNKIEEFNLTSAKCHMELISVEQKEYSNVGLGTTMFKEMEEFALREKCTEIYAIYEPYGAFADISPYFYQNNGFRIYYDLKRMCSCATKDLTQHRKNSTLNKVSQTKRDGKG